MGTYKKRRPLFSCLCILFFFCCTAYGSPVLLAQTQPPGSRQAQEKRQSPPLSRQPGSGQQRNSSQIPRQDDYYGNFHEGMVMETDPQSGDSIIQVGPPPKEETEPNRDNTYLITPEIKIHPRY